MESGKNKRWAKTLGNILFTIFMIVMTFLIFTTAQSKIKGEEPRLLGYRLYVVDSGSMSPTINMGSMIIVKEMEASKINKMDIITYYGHDKDSRVTHRAVDVIDNGKSFTTKGDANEVADPMPVEGEKLIGKVVLKIPYIGIVFKFLNTDLGMKLLIILIALGIIGPKIISKIKKSNKYVV